MNCVLLRLNVSFQKIVFDKTFEGILFRDRGDVCQIGNWDESQGDIEAFLLRLSAALSVVASRKSYSEAFAAVFDAGVSMQSALSVSSSVTVVGAVRSVSSDSAGSMRLPQGASYSSRSSRRETHNCVSKGCSKLTAASS